MPFRTSHGLGPDLEQTVDPENVWYDHPDVVSPQEGVPELGSDGHSYVWVQNGGSALTADARINISDDGEFTVSTSGTGTYQAIVDVPANHWFWARKFAL